MAQYHLAVRQTPTKRRSVRDKKRPTVKRNSVNAGPFHVDPAKAQVGSEYIGHLITIAARHKDYAVLLPDAMLVNLHQNSGIAHNAHQPAIFIRQLQFIDHDVLLNWGWQTKKRPCVQCFLKLI